MRPYFWTSVASSPADCAIAVLNGGLIGVTNSTTGKFIACLAGFWRNRLKSSAGLSAFVLMAVFGFYAVHWALMHGGFLFVPELQNDDARTALFPFHRYGMNPWLAR